MAADYGDARTGVAVSDISRSLTGDTWVIHSRKMNDVADSIVNEAINRGVSCIVVGYPKNMDGSIGERAEKSEILASLMRTMLSEKAVTGSDRSDPCLTQVVLWDERMTTLSAHRILDETGTYGKKRKKSIDAVAASLILESYLDSLK